jgi:hypothetical protein
MASSFDLHVLSTPPAFVLSQDQTLHQQTQPTTHTTKAQAASKKIQTRQKPTKHPTPQQDRAMN